MEDVERLAARDAAEREATEEGTRLERKRRFRFLIRVVAEAPVLVPAAELRKCVSCISGGSVRK